MTTTTTSARTRRKQLTWLLSGAVFITVIVVAELLDISLDSTFLLRRLAIELDPLEANVVSRDATRLTLRTDREGTWFKTRRTGTSPTGSMIAHCALEGRPCGTLEVQGIWVDDRTYRDYRRMGGGVEPEPPPADAAEPEPHTGRSLPRNRAISRLQDGEGPGRYAGTVLVDEDDPTFYERPLDHVAGLLLLDAVKQGTTAAVCRERFTRRLRFAGRLQSMLVEPGRQKLLLRFGRHFPSVLDFFFQHTR